MIEAILWITGWSFSWFLLGALYYMTRTHIIIRRGEEWEVRYDNHGEIYMLVKPAPTPQQTVEANSFAIKGE